MALIQMNFVSKYLRMNTNINILLPEWDRSAEPEDYYVKGTEYPVLWLLHGAWGDCSDWIRKSNIETYACERGLAVVMPSGYNSFYGNWPNYSGGLYAAKFIINELMPMIYAWYPISDRKEDNFMAGLSMGGQGTIKFAAEYPERFAAGAVLSAPTIDYRMKYEEEKNSPMHSHLDYVEAHGGLEQFLESDEYTRHVLTEMQKAGRIGELPPLYFETGGGDHLMHEYEECVEFLRGLGVDVELVKVGDYGHEWRYWDIGIQNALAYFEAINPKLKRRG